MGFGYTENGAKKTLLAQYFLFFISSIVFIFIIDEMIFYGPHTLIDGIRLVILLSLLTFSLVYFSLNREFLTNRITAKIVLQLHKNKFSKAEKIIEKKLKSNFMGYRPNWMNLKAMILIKKGELQNAVNLLNRLERKHPNFPQMLYFKACLKSLTGDTKNSLNYLIKFFKILSWIKKTSKNPLYRYMLNKNISRFISFAKNDEDLQRVRKVERFWKIINQFEQTR